MRGYIDKVPYKRPGHLRKRVSFSFRCPTHARPQSTPVAGRLKLYESASSPPKMPLPLPVPLLLIFLFLFGPNAWWRSPHHVPSLLFLFQVNQTRGGGPPTTCPPSSSSSSSSSSSVSGLHANFHKYRKPWVRAVVSFFVFCFFFLLRIQQQEQRPQ